MGGTRPASPTWKTTPFNSCHARSDRYDHCRESARITAVFRTEYGEPAECRQACF
ncbi:MAG: hypothetical protein MI923_08520 [Phycisphaerales bacterium]|nr:hypothetical protein [Phycisphaerales bacterium]